MPVEYLDFHLISELYHCTPEELDRQDSSITYQHAHFMRIKNQEERKQSKRAEQRSRLNKN